MAGHRFSKLEEFEDRHPGLCRQLEAMFKAFIPLRAIVRALQAQYGVRIGRASLREYQWECWNVWGSEAPEMSAALAAPQELAGEARLGVR